MKIILRISCSLLLSLISTRLFALENSTFGIGLGYFTGESREVVYDLSSRNYKVSELFWKTESSITLQGALHTEHENFKFDLSGWTPLLSNAQMDDYDWLYEGKDWSHWSTHPDTRVQNTYSLDLMISYILNAPKIESSWGVDLLLGYRILNLEWVSYGGSFIYSNTSSSGFRDRSGTFDPNEKGISYKQTYTTPYIGAGINHAFEKLQFEGRLLYSSWGQGKDFDTHHLRDTTFASGHKGIRMYEIALFGRYPMDPIRDLQLSISHQSYKENSRPADMIINESGIVTVEPNSAGIDHESTQLTASVIVKF